MKRIGPTFSMELIAAGLDQLVNSWVEGGTSDQVDLKDMTPEERARFDALIEAHDPDLLPPRQKTIFELVQILTSDEVDQLYNLPGFRRESWLLLARPNEPVMEDSPRVARLCTALGITPKSLFDRA